jgi:uncharacterized membrane protein YeaQ/YmgE (transglycosylase-associated protein family)
MNGIPWLADMQDLSGAELSLLTVGVLIFGLATGFFIDLVARPQGFGTFLNAIIALIGAAAGVYLRYHLLPQFPGNDAIVTSAAAFATAFLLICALFYGKSRIA